MTTITQASPAEIRDALASGEILLVDVREPNEYAFERIPGALLYPLSTFDPKAVPAEGRKVVVQCAAGGRSMRAAQALLTAGHHGRRQSRRWHQRVEGRRPAADPHRPGHGPSRGKRPLLSGLAKE